MPHRCMECKNVIESGSIDLANGCPVCGCKKFEYIRPPRKDANKSEKDLRKLTVAEYVAHAAAAETRQDEQNKKPKEPAKAPRAIRVELKAGAEANEPVPESVKPAHAEKKPCQERIESVRILEKGSYDINLPVLLNRKELVMSKEEGVYVVDLPSALKTPKKKNKKKRSSV